MSQEHKLVQEQYDRWASIYDGLWRGYVTRTIGALSEWARLQPGDRVLDVGCGTRAFADLLHLFNLSPSMSSRQANHSVLASKVALNSDCRR